MVRVRAKSHLICAESERIPHGVRAVRAFRAELGPFRAESARNRWGSVKCSDMPVCLIDGWLTFGNRNQEDILYNVLAALHNLIGNDWKGHGGAVFFVLGAYRNAKQELVTFA